MGLPFESFIGPFIPANLAANDTLLGLVPDLTGAFKLDPCFFALALPLAFKPPFGFLPSFLVHAGDFIISFSTTILCLPRADFNSIPSDFELIDKDNEYIENEGHTGKYPTTFKEWNIRKDDSGITSTDEQIDYFIKTYTNEEDTILDMTCHNNYVGNRCEHLNRNYIGVDLNIIN